MKYVAALLAWIAIMPGVMIVVLTPSAHADSMVDQLFTDTMCSKYSICFSPESMLDVAYTMCDDMASNPDFGSQDAWKEIWRNNTQRMSEYQAQSFVGAAIAAFCPDQKDWADHKRISKSRI